MIHNGRAHLQPGVVKLIIKLKPTKGESDLITDGVGCREQRGLARPTDLETYLHQPRAQNSPNWRGIFAGKDHSQHNCMNTESITQCLL